LDYRKTKHLIGYIQVQKNKTFNRVHTSPKNGRGQMTQTRAGVNITRKEKDGRPRVRWMKGPCDGVPERALERKKNSGWTEKDDVWELENVSAINKLMKCVCLHTQPVRHYIHKHREVDTHTGTGFHLYI
jgi:hypothetical protein